MGTSAVNPEVIAPVPVTSKETVLRSAANDRFCMYPTSPAVSLEFALENMLYSAGIFSKYVSASVATRVTVPVGNETELNCFITEY